MPGNKEILNELFTLSPAVAAISAGNVFSIPDNYFEEITENLAALVKQDLKPSFINVQVQTGSVPEGYFENLAGNILHRINIEDRQKELDEISPAVAAIGNKNVYAVPDGYFTSLTPDFHNINSTEELESLSPFLASIGNRNVFTAPAGYFQNLSSGIEKSAAPAKLVQMKKPGIFRYMVAAVVSGLIGLTLVNLPVANHTDAHVTTSQTAMVQPLKAQAKKIITDKNFDDELNNISENEIVAYLKDNGQDINAALVASATDENGLPNAEEYILDDNALDNFLNKINLKN